MGRWTSKKGTHRKSGAKEATEGDSALAAQPSPEGEPREPPGRGGRVIGFYGHHPSCKYHEFSNFWYLREPLDFQIPEFAQREGLPSIVRCEFSEKAIMLTKAAMMSDGETFEEMVKCPTPGAVKALGRQVKGFDDRLWTEHLDAVAYEVVRQKFAADLRLARLLLSTGDAVIAEATCRDKIWGIGLEVSDPRVQQPHKWQGRNVLGTALMRTRDFLRGRQAAAVATAAGDEHPEELVVEASASGSA